MKSGVKMEHPSGMLTKVNEGLTSSVSEYPGHLHPMEQVCITGTMVMVRA